MTILLGGDSKRIPKRKSLYRGAENPFASVAKEGGKTTTAREFGARSAKHRRSSLIGPTIRSPLIRMIGQSTANRTPFWANNGILDDSRRLSGVGARDELAKITTRSTDDSFLQREVGGWRVLEAPFTDDTNKQIILQRVVISKTIVEEGEAS